MRTALLIASFALASQAFAAELQLPSEGWASWEVAAVDAAPAYCCWANGRDYRNAPQAPCRLDNEANGYGNRDDETTDAVRIYARVAGGKVDRLRVLAASCPVEAATPIRDLGTVAEDDSARWLIGLDKQTDQSTGKRHGIGNHILAALAINRGNVARAALADMARNDARTETRKQAVFWLALVRGRDGEDIVSSVVLNDKDQDVREHAVFALSRLPDDRATPALIAVAENRTLSRDLRKKAVFWLSQSNSDSAQAYLDRVLSTRF
jgi:hypothetical protein